MYWNIDFELFSSVVFFILILSFYSKIRFPNIANQVYGYLLISSFIACIINIANCLILNNLTKGQIMKINTPVDISSYELPSTVSLIISNNASNIMIYNESFVNSTIRSYVETA